MNNELRTKNGFSLMEVLLAIGILSIGMIFIAGVFPAAIYMTTFSTEQSIAAAAADEAFAKIKLYIQPTGIPGILQYGLTDPNIINPSEFFYPSTNESPAGKQYCWSALFKRVGPTDVQTTVFVCRKMTGWIVPAFQLVDVNSIGVLADEIFITDAGKKMFINDGYTIVENKFGRIYRVLERYSPPNDNVVKLDRKWLGGSAVWVVPAPAGGGRYPCVAVYQKVIRF